MAQIQMTGEFRSALDLIAAGRNVLISGKAGTGKSTLLRLFLEHTGSRKVLVTAPTGVAAHNVDGFTIHRSFGFRPGMYPTDVEPGGSWRPPATRALLAEIDTLVVDEISMVRADLFDMMDRALRRIRGNDVPFGGVQLVLVGDLLQLPPVVEDAEREAFTRIWSTPYFFSSHVYRELQLTDVTLTVVWRQADSTFVDVLNEVREGAVGPGALEVLNSRVEPGFVPPPDWVTLASRRKTVAEINGRMLERLPGPVFTSVATRIGDTASINFGADDEFRYAVGARVMTVVNDPLGRYVNGSFGEITAASRDAVTVRLDHSGKEVEIHRHEWEVRRPTVASAVISSEAVGTIVQFPLILAWAITVHKSQGKTIPKCFIDLKGGMTTDGQFYVALSRAVDLEHLRLSAPVEARHIRASNSLVRRVRRESSTAPAEPVDRVVCLSFDGVSFGVSEHVAQIGVVVLAGGQVVAEFGSWINPMSDLGDFGRQHRVPAGGLAMAPSLGDFWPLLRRQAAGGIVVGDRLAMLERAVRHQEKGMAVDLGTGYDAEELDLQVRGADVMTRARAIAAAVRAGRVRGLRGRPVPPADREAEGAVFLPAWAPHLPMRLDPAQATASDQAWAAMSGADHRPVDRGEVAECGELLSAWAISRGFWNHDSRSEILDRLARLECADVDLPSLVEWTTTIDELLGPGTRVAFTGRDNLLGGPADDDRLAEICADRALVYKTGVSRTRCDVLVALDVASMSRKAQNAREFGKPIIAQADFEEWYRSTAQRRGAPSRPQPAAPASAPAPKPVADAQTRPAPGVGEPLRARAADVLADGTRVAFRGSTVVDGMLYPHGERLRDLCVVLGLDYKQAVTKTRCDVLVTDDFDAEDGKSGLARRYAKPMVATADFADWAAQRLATLTAELDEQDTEVPDHVAPAADAPATQPATANQPATEGGAAEDFDIADTTGAAEPAAPFAPAPNLATGISDRYREAAMYRHPLGQHFGGHPHPGQHLAPEQRPVVAYAATNPAAQLEKQEQAKRAWRYFGIATAVWALIFVGLMIAVSVESSDGPSTALAGAWLMFGFVWTGFGGYAIYRHLEAKKRP